MSTDNLFLVRPPTLDRWEIKRHTAAIEPHLVYEVTVTAWCARRKRPLFSHVETVCPESDGLRVSDCVHHFTLVLEQDRPITLTQFERGLMGALWDQPELPFD